MEEKVFQVNKLDNVAVALTPIVCGNAVHMIGETDLSMIVPVTDIPIGHKISVRDICEGEDIVKYGVVIGHAVKNIPKGAWVHLNEMASNYDERSAHLDAVTGAPKDMKYI